MEIPDGRAFVGNAQIQRKACKPKVKPLSEKIYKQYAAKKGMTKDRR